MTAYAVQGTASRAVGADNTVALNNVGGLNADNFPPGGDIFLRVKVTTGPATVSITWPTAADAYGDAKADLVLGGGPLATGADRTFGPFPAAEFADPSDGQVHVKYSATTLTAGVYRYPDN